MKKIRGKEIKGLPGPERDSWYEPPSYKEVFGHIKKPDDPLCNIIITCNPTGPDIFHKNFIDNETDK